MCCCAWIEFLGRLGFSVQVTHSSALPQRWPKQLGIKLLSLFQKGKGQSLAYTSALLILLHVLPQEYMLLAT